MCAVVKFFNDLPGYGFVTADNLDEDVFVYSRVLNDCGFHSLMQGQKLLVRVDNSTRGLQVNSFKLLSERGATPLHTPLQPTLRISFAFDIGRR